MSKHTILQGKDVLVNLPTGYGKTFVYQLLPIAVTEILRSFLLGDRPVLFKKRTKRFDLCLRLLARASPLLSRLCAEEVGDSRPDSTPYLNPLLGI